MSGLQVQGTLRPMDRDRLRDRSPVVAPRLLGCLLVSDVGDHRVVGRVVEVEAYRESDAASHSHRGRTPGNATMFGPPGHAYVYFTYGMHHCVNVTCEPAGTGSAVLLRAVEVVAGRDVAVARRDGRAGARELASGPGRLTQALAIDREHDGVDLLAGAGPLQLCTDEWHGPRGGIRRGPRTGVRHAADRRWRWWLDGVRAVSPHRRHPRA